MKKVLIVGVLGMAGHVMAEYLHALGVYQIFGIARSPGKFVTKQMDITDFQAVQIYLSELKPDIVINCVGLLVEQSKNNVCNAILINSYFPHFLSNIGKQLAFKFIHISTDCVFSGKHGQYKEDSFRDGDDNYARTKALGELVNDYDLTIRTSIIGPELKQTGSGLLNWFFKQSGSIKGYTNAYWSGVTTLELAKAMHAMIQQELVGLFQLCPLRKISKYDLLVLFSDIWHKKITINPFDDYVVDKSLVCTRSGFIYPSLDYETMLIELRQWMIMHENMYTDTDTCSCKSNA